MTKRFLLMGCAPADWDKAGGGSQRNDWFPISKFGSLAKAIAFAESIENTQPQYSKNLPQNQRWYLSIEAEHGNEK